MSKLPTDRFDDTTSTPSRVGAHRRRIARRPWWFHTAIAGGSVVAIVLAALVGVSIIDAKNLQAIDLPAVGITATPTPTPTPTPEQDVADPLLMTDKELKNVTITVLNGTAEEGIAESVVTMLETTGWRNATPANASDSTIKVSVVVYGPEADLRYANGVAASLGIKAVKQSDMYPGATVTVLVGSDFVQQ